MVSKFFNYGEVIAFLVSRGEARQAKVPFPTCDSLQEFWKDTLVHMNAMLRYYLSFESVSSSTGLT